MSVQPKGAKMINGVGEGKSAPKRAGKSGNQKAAGAHKGKSPAHAYKGGGSGHYGKKVRQTANAKHEGNAMLKGSGMGAASSGRKHNAGTFMSNLVANKSRVIRGY